MPFKYLFLNKLRFNLNIFYLFLTYKNLTIDHLSLGPCFIPSVIYTETYNVLTLFV